MGFDVEVECAQCGDCGDLECYFCLSCIRHSYRPATLLRQCNWFEENTRCGRCNEVDVCACVQLCRHCMSHRKCRPASVRRQRKAVRMIKKVLSVSVFKAGDITPENLSSHMREILQSPELCEYVEKVLAPRPKLRSLAAKLFDVADDQVVSCFVAMF